MHQANDLLIVVPGQSEVANRRRSSTPDYAPGLVRSRMANEEDACSGSFWESRFRSVAVLDEESLLATAAYIDLNPVAAAMAATPESSQHTSLHERIEQYQETETLETIRDDLSSLTSNPAQEADLWLLPQLMFG